jgi:HAD superfamily hydrolase (TIGR01549 family)
MIKLITIDFWNTLFDSGNGIERNAYRYRTVINEIDKHGIMIKQDEFIKAMQASWAYFDNIWKFESRTPSPNDTVEFFWNFLKIPYDEEAIKRVSDEFGDCILKYPPNLIDGVPESLEKLSKKFDLAIVSDTGFSLGSSLRKLMQNKGIYDYFKAFSFSDETGVSKPHEKAFKTILNQLNYEPHEAIHIGDIEETDIKGAKKLGMGAIRFSGDKTSRFNIDEKVDTQADAFFYSWEEIVSYIEKKTEDTRF